MKISKKVALAGVICSLSLVCMLLSAIVPFAEYSCPALAGILLVALVIDINKKTALLAYLAISIISIIIIPNKEVAVLFVGFLGYYPILKNILEQSKSKIIEWLLKLVIFNVMVLLSYQIIIHLFGIVEIFDDFGKFKDYGMIILLGLGNIAFILYDLALTNLIAVYLHKIKPRIKVNLK